MQANKRVPALGQSFSFFPHLFFQNKGVFAANKNSLGGKTLRWIFIISLSISRDKIPIFDKFPEWLTFAPFFFRVYCRQNSTTSLTCSAKRPNIYATFPPGNCSSGNFQGFFPSGNFEGFCCVVPYTFPWRILKGPAFQQGCPMVGLVLHQCCPDP